MTSLHPSCTLASVEMLSMVVVPALISMCVWWMAYLHYSSNTHNWLKDANTVAKQSPTHLGYVFTFLVRNCSSTQMVWPDLASLSAEITFTRTSIRLVHRRMKSKLHNAITNASFCVCIQWPTLLLLRIAVRNAKQGIELWGRSCTSSL